MQIGDKKDTEQCKKLLIEMIKVYNNKYKSQITLGEFIKKRITVFTLSKNNKKYWWKIFMPALDLLFYFMCVKVDKEVQKVYSIEIVKR